MSNKWQFEEEKTISKDGKEYLLKSFVHTEIKALDNSPVELFIEYENGEPINFTLYCFSGELISNVFFSIVDIEQWRVALLNYKQLYSTEKVLLTIADKILFGIYTSVMDAKCKEYE